MFFNTLIKYFNINQTNIISNKELLQATIETDNIHIISVLQLTKDLP